MRGTVLYGPRDVRFEDRAEPTIVEPTDAIISLPATCICGSDLWPYRGIQTFPAAAAMGHGKTHSVLPFFVQFRGDDYARRLDVIVPG